MSLAGVLLVPNGLALVFRCLLPLPGECRVYSAGREAGVVLSLLGVVLLLVGLWILSRPLDYSALRSESGGKDWQSIIALTPGRVQVVGLLLLLASASVNLVPAPERVLAFHDFDFNPDNPDCRISPTFLASRGEVVDIEFWLYFVAEGSLHWSGRAIGSVVPVSQAEERPCRGGVPGTNQMKYIPEDGTYVFYVGHYGSFPWPNYTMVVDGTVTIRSADAYLVPQIAVAAVGVGLVSVFPLWSGRRKPEESPEA